VRIDCTIASSLDTSTPRHVGFGRGLDRVVVWMVGPCGLGDACTVDAGGVAYHPRPQLLRSPLQRKVPGAPNGLGVGARAPPVNVELA
jgi:hypothetical protein